MAKIVSGEITFPAGTPTFSGATLYARIEATGMLDAPAQVIAQSIQKSVAYSGNTLPFSIEGTIPQGQRHLSLRVHISMDGNSDFERGDYINKQAYHINTDTLPATIHVAVEAI